MSRLVASTLLCVSISAAVASCTPNYNLWARDVTKPLSRSSFGGTYAVNDDVKTVSGELATLTSRRLTIETQQETVAVRLSDDTRITIDGRRARLADLQQRQFAVVTASERAGDLTARAIEARSRMQ